MVPEVLLPTMPSLLAARNAPFIHRDLSWLQFNDRVLAEARLSSNPLLERVKFLSITSSNLAEFFMIRLSSLNQSISSARRNDPRLEKRLLRIRQNILEAVSKFIVRQKETLQSVSNELALQKIFIARNPSKDNPSFEIGKKLFREQIFPQLTAPQPFAIQKLSSLENLQIGAILEPQHWFVIPKNLPSLILHQSTKGEEAYAFFLDDLLMSHLAEAFGLEGTLGMVRLTRDADFNVDLTEEDSESVPDAIRSSIRTRDRGRLVRLQWMGSVHPQILQRALHLFRFDSRQIISMPSTFLLNGLWTLYQQAPDRANAKIQLRYPPLISFVPKQFRRTEKIFERLQQKDYLLHHPYDSFDSFVSWIKEACSDSKVEMIELTVYRVDTLSAVVDALKSAAKKKDIRVIIELRARFDELNNLQLADALRKAGVKVSFGFGKLKVHAKLALVTRNEGSLGRRYYSHLSTGNYNAMTARQYTDLAIITGNQEIGADVKHFFDSVWSGKEPTIFKHLVSAPSKLHRKLMSLIQAEMEAAKEGKKSKIFAKVNALVDESIIQQLYLASQAGVQIDLIVRGACSLIPGVKGLSENIRVISIVDRFLEHSRIYYFENSKALYLSSADWMPRNFFSRLEIAFPVLDQRLYRYLEETLIPIYWLDTVKSRELTAQGIWRKRSMAQLRAGDKISLPQLLQKKNASAQRLFQENSATSYQGTILNEKSTLPPK